MLFALACTLAFPLTILAGESDWPRFRGPKADGHSADSTLPVKWDESSVAWKVDLKGLGHSSPIVWGRRIFLTAALDGGRQRLVFALDRNDGTLLWRRVARRGEPEPIHEVNGHASATCVTDGRRVYAFFGKGGLHCYTVAGRHVWSRDLGPFAGPWGSAASPILVGDAVVQNCDADQDARIVALNKHTGQTLWSTPRDNHRGWSTPIVIRRGNGSAVVVNGHTGVTAYDPADGKPLWFCKSFIGRGTPSVTRAGGLLHVVNGLRGDVYAIRPGGSGDVTESHIAWHTHRRSRDIASPIVVGAYLLVMSLRGGLLSCYAAADGEHLWTARTPVPTNFSASPISYRGIALFTAENGQTLAVKPGRELRIVAHNTLPADDAEIFRASITPSAGRLFVRSDRALYCISSVDKATRKSVLWKPVRIRCASAGTVSQSAYRSLVPRRKRQHRGTASARRPAQDLGPLPFD